MNPCFRDRVRKAAQLCESGIDLGEALNKAHLDPRIGWVGRLHPDAGSIADAFRQLHDDLLTRESSTVAVAAILFEPLFILAVGAMVAGPNASSAAGPDGHAPGYTRVNLVAPPGIIHPFPDH